MGIFRLRFCIADDNFRTRFFNNFATAENLKGNCPFLSSPAPGHDDITSGLVRRVEDLYVDNDQQTVTLTDRSHRILCIP